MSILLWLFTIVGALLGGLILLAGLLGGGSEPKETAAGVVVACAVIPYVLARAWDALRRRLAELKQPSTPSGRN